MVFLWLKWVHVLCAVVLLGTGIGIAFFMFRANATREIGAIRFALKNAVLADLIFTLPALVLVPVTGHFMMQTGSTSIKDPWMIISLALFFLAGLCWLAAFFLQRRMRGLAEEAAERGTDLSPDYWKYERIWFWLGVVAFPAVVGIFFLMIFQPVLG